MNSFDINRFGKALRWILSVNLRSWTMWTLGFTFGVLLIELLMLILFPTDMQHYHDSLDFIAVFFDLFIIIGIGVSISNVFLNMNKKPRRQAFLMLPATNLEKYVAAVLFALVSGIVMMVFSYVVGDSMRVAFRALAYGDPWNSFSFPILLDILSFDGVSPAHSMGYRLGGLAFLVSGMTWLHSFYTLGGTLLRKHAFVITSIALMAGATLFTWLAKGHNFSMFYTSYSEGKMVVESVGTMTYVFIAFFAVFSVVNYWASFHIFKAFELITKKWLNYDFHK